MDTLTFSIYFLCCTVAGCFLAGLTTRNYSQVDRLWSVLPPVYALIWLIEFYKNPVYIVPALLVVIWGSRLTWNFHRRGGYLWKKGKGFTGEDYRWPILKEKIPNRLLFELFNLLFISFFQLTLIFLFTLPLYFLGETAHVLNIADIILYLAFAGLLFMEFVADQQQYNYHSSKKTQKNKDARFLLGFNTYGLWKYSRHPNYMAEIGQWIVLWLLLVNANGKLHWSGIGALFLVFLFIGSTLFTEKITASKYPEYRLWKKATPAFIPFLTAPLRKKSRKIFWAKIGE